MAERVLVAGVGMVPFATPSRSEPYDVMAESATKAALADAGVDLAAIRQAYAGYVYGDSTSGQNALYRVGMTGIPVINVVLCFRGLLRGDDVALPYAITAISLAALSVAAIGVSLWMLSRESLLVSENGTAWSNFLGLFRSPRGSR